MDGPGKRVLGTALRKGELPKLARLLVDLGSEPRRKPVVFCGAGPVVAHAGTRRRLQGKLAARLDVALAEAEARGAADAEVGAVKMAERQQAAEALVALAEAQATAVECARTLNLSTVLLDEADAVLLGGCLSHDGLTGNLTALDVSHNPRLAAGGKLVLAAHLPLRASLQAVAFELGGVQRIALDSQTLVDLRVASVRLEAADVALLSAGCACVLFSIRPNGASKISRRAGCDCRRLRGRWRRWLWWELECMTPRWRRCWQPSR